jgi:DNA-binding transcriptional MerR regulator/methylmalonyl-CoA mutase cobalamin-binding subunit
MNDETKSARGPFRIATVAELTGVPEPTLRAWERRYGVPVPERAASGYRLYGETEVDEIRLMRTLCDEGMAAAEAARQVTSRRGSRGPKREAVHGADPYRAAVSAMLDSVMDFDTEAFEQEVRRLPLLGGVTTILDRVVVPFLREVGDRWHSGDFSIAHERLATERMSTFLRDLLRLATDDEPTRERVLLACFGDDEHELGLFIAAIRLATWGYRSVVLGGRIPPSSLHTAVKLVGPRLVALSITLPITRSRARELAEEYAAACANVPWVVGGSGASPIADIIEKLGGRVVEGEPEQLRAAVRDLARPDAKRGPKAR